MISDNFLYEIMEEVRLAAEGVALSFMEAFTIGAFLAFSKIPADVLIIECGMGGRIDITNIIEKKLATLIMPISFDHMEYLGNSIERIALEKAMIMRKDTPLIVASQPSAAKNIIKILANDQEIPTYFYDEDFSIIMDSISGKFDFEFGDIFFENLPSPALRGPHQYINFATAIATISLLKEKFNIQEIHLRQAISNVYWPSRIEKIQNTLNKILDNSESEIWIDGAHNEAGAFALARWILEQDDGKENFVICGFSRAKCKTEFLEKFKNIAEVLAVRVNGEPYPEDPEKISQIGSEIGMNILPFSDLDNALYQIKKISADQACRVIICGSLHLARDVKRLGN